jgi:hypothetical protein
MADIKFSMLNFQFRFAGRPVSPHRCRVKRRLPFRNYLAAFGVLVAALLPPTIRAEWQREDTTIAWVSGTNVFWRFSFDPSKGKPFFNPVAPGGRTPLNGFRPSDHPWHYGLWFSWKYINHVNYWEEDKTTGKAEGATRWDTPKIETRENGSAVIRMELRYVHPSNRVDLTESRTLIISAPADDGGFTIDWRAHFTAGPAGAVLDRTPMPGEPQGQVNGGYAGLGLRMAQHPVVMSVVSTAGEISEFKSDRARPDAPAVACNCSEDSRDLGGIAVFSDPANAGENAPWYVINSRNMRFLCAAILAPSIRALPAGGTLDLHYFIAVHPHAWTPAELIAVRKEWLKSQAH